MGLTVENNTVELSDGDGNTRFTTDQKMPHFMYSASGSITVPEASGTSVYTSGVDYYGTPWTSWTGSSINQTQEFNVIVNNNITNTGPQSFVYAFYTISGGDNDTGGASIAGSGSMILRILVDGEGYFRGIVTCTPIVQEGKVVFSVKTTLNDAAGGVANIYPQYSGSGSPTANQSNPVTFTGTSYTFDYRVYYGRVR